MRILPRDVDAFFRSLAGVSLEGVVLNPLKRRLGDTVRIPGIFDVEEFVLDGIADVVKDDESRSGPIHLVHYLLNEATEGEPRRFKLSMYARPKKNLAVLTCPFLELVESRPFNAWADENALDNEDGKYSYGGKIWDRVGKDLDGVTTNLYIVRDEDGNGKVTAEETDKGEVTIWSFHDTQGTSSEYLDVVRGELGINAGFWRGKLANVANFDWTAKGETVTS